MPSDQFDLIGLDEVEWSELEHAYGPADDLPEMLRTLASGGDATEAYMQLCESLCHQGSVYSATPRVIPFVLQLLSDPGSQGPLLMLLDAMSESTCDEECGDPELVPEIRAGLEQGLTVIAGCLMSDDPAARQAAAQILGRLDARAQQAAPAILARLAEEQDAEVRAALSEAITRLGGEYTPPDDAAPLERFRAAYVIAQKKGRKCDDQTLAEIVRHWGAVRVQQETGARTLVTLAAEFDKVRRFDFLCALMADAARDTDSLALACQILVVAFGDVRKWGGHSIGNNFLVDGKPWMPRDLGSPFPGVTVEQAMVFQERLVKASTVEETKQVLAELHSMEDRPPENAVTRTFVVYSNPRGPKPKWKLPLASAQKRALATIAANDAAWSCDTNLWSLFGLPSSREQFQELLKS
jgi:hypothetical protein